MLIILDDGGHGDNCFKYHSDVVPRIGELVDEDRTFLGEQNHCLQASVRGLRVTAARSEKRIRWEMRHPGVVWVGKSASGRTVAHLHKLGQEWEWMVVPDDVERPLRREKAENIYAAKRAAQEAFSG
jgi:hypothetical protein